MGAAYNAVMEEETKASLAEKYVKQLNELRELRTSHNDLLRVAVGYVELCAALRRPHAVVDLVIDRAMKLK